MADFEEYIKKCAVCGEEVGERFRFCPACGSPVPEPEPEQPIQPSPPEAAREERDEEEYYPPRTAPRRPDVENAPSRPVRIRTNADSAEIRFREFSAVARKRRRHDDRKSVIPLILALLVFLGSIGGGIYWFFRQAEELPWDSVVVERPVVKKSGEVPLKTPESGGIDLVDPGDTGKPAVLPAVGQKDIEELKPEKPVTVASPAEKPAEEIPAITGPARGVVIGSGVNLRGSSTIESPVVGKVSAGKKVEVLESRTPDDSAEAVTLTDAELTAPDGKKIKVARGRGVTVAGKPDASGLVAVTLPGEKSKTVYRVPYKSLSDPQAWPWYRIRPQGGSEGWIFGKFLTILDPGDEGLSPLFLDNALASFGTTRDQLAEGLGKPSKTSSKKVKTSAGEGSEVTMTFKGASVILLEGPGGNEVRRIALSSPEHLLGGGLKVGADRRQVLSILGHPNDLAGGAEIYRVDKSSGIKIVYENYKIKSITAGALN